MRWKRVSAKYSLTTRLSNIILAVLVLSMLLFQTGYMVVKLALILVLFAINLFKGEYRPSRYSATILRILFVIIAYGFYCVASAELNNTLTGSELLERMPILLVYPFLYYMIIPNIMGDKVKNLCNILVVGHFAMVLITIYNIYAVFHGMNPIMLHEDETYAISEESMGVSSGTTYQILFTMPVFFVIGWSKMINKWVFLIGSILTISYVLISGGSALMVIMLMCLLIPFISKRLLGKENVYIVNLKKMIVPLLIIFSVVIVRLGEIEQLQSFYTDFQEHFTNEDERYEQRQLFIKEWQEHPLFGGGYGKTFRTSVKGSSKAFESMYHLMLATTGIVGFGLFATYIFMIIKNLYKRIRRTRNPYYLGMLLGLISCVICNSTNPLLASFDRLLSVYFCIACLAVRLPLVGGSVVTEKQEK